MSGILTGIGTEAAAPVAMPIIAIRLKDAARLMGRIGELGDIALLHKYSSLQQDLTSVEARLDEILSEQMPCTVFQAPKVNPAVRRHFNDGLNLVQPAIRAFCKRPPRDLA